MQELETKFKSPFERSVPDHSATFTNHAFPSRSVFVGIETSAFSGATLLSFLLNAHPQIASIGEMSGLILKNPDEYVCSCGSLIRQCEFWQAMSGAMEQRGHVFDVGDFATQFQLNGPRWMQRLRSDPLGHRILDTLRDATLKTWPTERRQFTQLVTRNAAFVESVLQLTGKRIFVDTSKDRLRARALEMFSPYDIRIIHLVRDPRGVVASRLKRGRKITVSRAAYEWVWLHTRLQGFSCFATAKYVRVRYEDLCRESHSLLPRLYSFCGADPDFEPGDLHTTMHHIVGNPMRLDHYSEIKLDEGWREFLTREQQREIWQIAGDLSKQYGYAWE